MIWELWVLNRSWEQSLVQTTKRIGYTLVRVIFQKKNPISIFSWNVSFSAFLCCQFLTTHFETKIAWSSIKNLKKKNCLTVLNQKLSKTISMTSLSQEIPLIYLFDKATTNSSKRRHYLSISIRKELTAVNDDSVIHLRFILTFYFAKPLYWKFKLYNESWPSLCFNETPWETNLQRSPCLY